MGERQTWTTPEFGSSHEGAVGVLLADGTVPGPVFFPLSSSAGGQTVSEWSVYDGAFAFVPRAHALRAVCSCGWTGPEHPLDWDDIGEQKLAVAGGDAADRCLEQWDEHTTDVERSAVPLPETVTDLLRRLSEEIQRLGTTSPLAAVRAARQLEVTAERVAYWAAHDARDDASLEQAAGALGLNEDDARHLLARFGGWSPYS
ncbi:hypothetical protein ACFVSN_17410 [Kitasatospora sp. NPDC057904]|uniref:hypothetical protein n=1 Tax=Kitasatospora sp. NPDC057904 TaxID=3346275 RepID=UPI0036DAC90E